MKDKVILTAFLAIVMITAPLFFIKTQATPPAQENEQNGDMQTEDSVTFNVYNCETGQLMELEGREYIISVLAGEMPASFETEALKAQAVAAFTYAYRRKISGDTDEKHIGAELCTDSTHCKAYADKDAMKEKWGKEYEKYLNKITDAVDAVYGQIMTYDEEPIDAVFHAISSGKTEAAEDVWGNEIPYLVAVDSATDEATDGYLTKTEVSREDFIKILSEFNEEAEFDGDENTWLKNISRSDSGGIITAELCGIPVSGRNIRKLFQLRSTNFELSYSDGNFLFTVKGYGHGVGMSQNGANALAKGGYTYSEILKHYYTGVDFESVI